MEIESFKAKKIKEIEMDIDYHQRKIQKLKLELEVYQDGPKKPKEV